jgi:hypothetical protein
MKKLTLVLIIFISVVLAGQVNLAFAQDMGKKLKLKDDGKQEFNQVMEVIKKAIDGSKFIDDLKATTDTTSFAYSNCRIKYYGLMQISESSMRYEYIFSLSDMESAEPYITDSKYARSGKMFNVSLKARDFNKAVNWKVDYYGTREDHHSETSDAVSIRVSSEAQAEELAKAFNKAIKLCAGK